MTNDISPVKVKDLPAFLAAIEPIARELAKATMNCFTSPLSRARRKLTSLA